MFIEKREEGGGVVRDTHGETERYLKGNFTGLQTKPLYPLLFEEKKIMITFFEKTHFGAECQVALTNTVGMRVICWSLIVILFYQMFELEMYR